MCRAPWAIVATAFLPATWGPAFGLAALLGLVGAGVGYALGSGRRLRSEELVLLAQDAGEAGDLEGALRWLRRARKRRPDDVTLALDEGWHLAALGRVEEAVALYEGLEGRLPPGHAPWLMAVTLFDHGADVARVEALVVRALEAAPVFFEELAMERRLASVLAGRPRFEAAKAEARRRLRGS